jgi:hypothetical protein
MRAQEAGVDEWPYIKAMAYLLLSALYRCDIASVIELLEQVGSDSEIPRYAEVLQEIVIPPVLNQLTRELRDVCTGDCVRVSTELVELTEEERDKYLIVSDFQRKTAIRLKNLVES